MFQRIDFVNSNIVTWKKVMECKYSVGKFDNIDSYLSDSYQWHGTLGADYSFNDPVQKESLRLIYQGLIGALSEVKRTEKIFGEGNMLGCYFLIEGIHSGNYHGLVPTGNRVKFFGVAIARFDKDGLLVEERELWDEVEMLKCFGLIEDKDETCLTKIFSNRNNGVPLPVEQFESRVPCAVDDVLYLHEPEYFQSRDPDVVRNEGNWRRFLNIKYFGNNFEGIDEVMSPLARWQAPAGVLKDMASPEDRDWLFQALRTSTAHTRDFEFTSHVFGQGDMLVYNVACEYTNTGVLFGNPPTGRKLLHPNICVCQFDRQGRVYREWEIYDLLAIYKQLGVIPDDDRNLSLLDVLKNIPFSEV